MLAQTTTEITTDKGQDQEYAGWYCIETNPWPCACGEFVAHHITAMHLILLWPEDDDPRMLKVANEAKKVDRNPRVVEYEIQFGPAISFYQWEAQGRMVHRPPT